ncbi:unnamed protein product [Phytophthora fragariaefolia]|uniref:Unnamed protein product n=1 Tax=Phytophthora fragariaefolia TaxID=1490495 RepID=A0A9W6Y7S7_9STRA|nr:unnamed protein product [Phytophthora fragariaefolia]
MSSDKATAAGAVRDEAGAAGAVRDEAGAAATTRKRSSKAAVAAKKRKAAATPHEAAAAAAARDEVAASKNRFTGAAPPPKKQRTGNSSSECDLDTTASLPPASAAYNDDVSEASTSVKVKAEFWNTGYTVVPGFIDEDEVEIVRNAISALDGRRVLCDIRNTLRQQTDIEITANRDVDPVVFRWILDRVIKFASDMHPAWSISER